MLSAGDDYRPELSSFFSASLFSHRASAPPLLSTPEEEAILVDHPVRDFSSPVRARDSRRPDAERRGATRFPREFF